MFERKVIGAVTLVASLMSGTASMALTSAEVWANWQASVTGMGGKVSAATEVVDGEDLRLNGVTMSSPNGATLTMSEVLLTPGEDEGVVIVPEGIALTGPKGSTQVEIAQEGLAIGVYEDAGGLGYSLAADLLSVAFGGGAATEGSTGMTSGTVRLEALEANYERPAESALIGITAATMTYTIDQMDKALGLNQKQKSVSKDMDLSVEVTLPATVDLMKIETASDFAAALKLGLALVAEFKQGASESTLSDTGETMPMALRMTAATATTGIEMSGERIAMGTDANGIAVVVTPPMVPQEITASVDKLMVELAMPVMAAEAAGEYTYQTKITNLVIADAGWAMIDPTGALPHTPADLDLDLGGTAKIDLLDLMTASEEGRAPAVMPELLSLDIRSMGLKLAGAALSGTGAFTFDNAMVAQGGPPMPIGTAAVRLEGGNKLIDGLIALGLMTADDATGARVMMGMFGKVEGDDVLTSAIEAKAGGSIFVNGQQIQ